MIPRRNIKLYEKGLASYAISWLKDRRKTNYFLEFKKELARFFSNENVFLLGKGRQALHLIFDSVPVPPGKEIIIPNYYLKSLVPLIKSKGLIPVFCDIDEKIPSCGPENLLSKINQNTAFILICHTFGFCNDIKKIVEKSKEKKKDVLIIEDCAHAFGSEYKNRKLGTFGDFSFFSFNYIKTLTTLEGGALFVNNGAFTEKIKKNYDSYKFPGKRQTFKKIFFYYFFLIAFDSPLLYLLKSALRKRRLRNVIKNWYHSCRENKTREGLSPFLAYIGYHQLRLFGEKQKKLSLLLRWYKKYLKAELWQNQPLGQNSKNSNYCLILFSEKKSSEIEKKLSKKNVDVGIKDEILDLCGEPENLQNSKKVFESSLQIPFYHLLSENRVKKISQEINKTI